MASPQPGWSVAGFAAGLSVSSWLPWLTTPAGGGGRASAIGGTVGIALPARFGAGQLIVLLASVLVVLGAMAARSLSERPAAAGAVALSVIVGVLIWWYFHVNVLGDVSVGYGFYVGAACAAGVLGSSVWALASTVRR